MREEKGLKGKRVKSRLKRMLAKGGEAEKGKREGKRMTRRGMGKADGE